MRATNDEGDSGWSASGSGMTSSATTEGGQTFIWSATITVEGSTNLSWQNGRPVTGSIDTTDLDFVHGTTTFTLYRIQDSQTSGLLLTFRNLNLAGVSEKVADLRFHYGDDSVDLKDAVNGGTDAFHSFYWTSVDPGWSSGDEIEVGFSVIAASGTNNAATGKPGIAGTAQVGQTLTANKGSIADTDGLTKADNGDSGYAYTYQWIRVATDNTESDIATNGTSKTYTAVAADQGKKLKVKVSFQDDAGNAESRTSDATGTVEPVALPVVTIAEGTSPVTEGTAATFTLSRTGATTAALPVTVAVSESGAMISGTAPTSVTFAVGDATKTLSVPTATDSTDENNSVITATVSAGTGYTAGTGSFGSAEAGSAEVVVRDDDVVTCTSGAPADAIWSSCLRVAKIGGVGGGTAYYGYDPGRGKSGELSQTAFTVSGTGHTINELIHEVLKSGQVTILDDLVLSFVSAPGDAAAKWVLWTAADEPFQLGYEDGSTQDTDYLWLNAGLTWTEGQVLSVWMTANNSATGAPTISGTPQVGVELTASTSGISDSNGKTKADNGETGYAYTYQWIRVDSDNTETDIDSATASAYTPVTADQGKTLKVRVSYKDDTGLRETLTSTATGEVAAAAAPAVTLVLSSSSIGENGGTSTVTATVSPASATAFTVTVAAAPVSPAVEGDFTVTSNKTLSFTANATSSTGTVTITAVNNDVNAADKTVTVSGTASINTVTAPSDVTLTITDDDDLAVDVVVEVVDSVGGSEVVVTSVAEDTGTATVRVTADTNGSEVPTTIISFSVFSRTTGHTATNNVDFTAFSNSISIGPAEFTLVAGEQHYTAVKTLTLTIANDVVDEEDETFELRAQRAPDTPTYVTLPADLEITITDDDEVPGAPTNLAAVAGDAQVVLTWAAPTAAGTSAITGYEYSYAPTGESFSAWASVGTALTATVTGLTNGDAHEFLVRAVSAAGAGAAASQDATPQAATASPAVTLVLTPASIGENGGTSTVTATVSPASATAFTVTVAAAPVSPATSDDFTVTSNKTLSFTANAASSTGTVTITAVNNDVDAADKTVTVSGTASINTVTGAVGRDPDHYR